MAAQELCYTWPRRSCAIHGRAGTVLYMAAQELCYTWPRRNCALHGRAGTVLYMAAQELCYTWPRRNCAKHGRAGTVLYMAAQELCYTWPRRNCAIHGRAGTVLYMAAQELCYTWPRRNCAIHGRAGTVLYMAAQELCYTWPRRNCAIHGRAGTVLYMAAQELCYTWPRRNCAIHGRAGTVLYMAAQELRKVAFTAARFTGEGFLHYTDTAQHNLSTTYISFQLLTWQRDGLILWNGQVFSQKDDFLAIGLKNGHLKVVVSLGWWTQGDLITRDVVSDGQWHSVIFQRLDQDLSVDINGQVTKVKLSGDDHHLDTLGQYHVGGFEEAVVKEQTSNHFDQAYIGCIRHLVVNKHSPPLSLLHPLGGANVFSCDDD
ncbi:hypothetical protein LSAT2_010870 [Lamellibrachia satsuma]|nr:hypothetical protein LSAT2_010870 [Lamellibrachia satsuma]